MGEKIIMRINPIPRLPPQYMYVGIYCRVSTKSQEQLHSLANQISHFIRLYSDRYYYRIRDVYIDIASGSTTDRRNEYTRMLRDCQNRKIDIVITKSLSRFGRNTAEALQAIRKLKALSIQIIFEEESIDTYKIDSELILSLMAGVAQAENEARSENTRWGLKKRAQNGTSGLYRRRCYGYRQNHHGNLEINEDEAITVRMIFEAYINGASIGKIQGMLESEAIPSPTGKSLWCKRTIDMMLSNEKYCGNIMLMKTISEDRIGSKRVMNIGQAPRYMSVDNHPPIVSKETFDRVQEEKLRRSHVIMRGGVIMPRASALINKETLLHICSGIGVTNAFLAQRMHISEEIVAKWLTTDNAAVPTINQAKILAKVLRVPFAGLYMSKENINIKHLTNLRNLRTMPDGIAIDDSALNLAIVDLIRARDLLHSSEEELGLKKTHSILPAVPNSELPAEYARVIRSFFGLDLNEQYRSTSTRQFYLYVRKKLESKGVFVHCFTGIEVEAVRGIAIFDEANPIIGINDDDRYPAKTFTIIHELVHILKRQSTLCNDMYSSCTMQREEVFCNAVAGEVLVPTDALTAYFNAYTIYNISLDTIKTVADRFSVSREVITRRMFDIGRFSKDAYDTFTNEIKQSFEQEREDARVARLEGRAQPVPRNMSREAIDKTSASLCRVMLIGYGEGLFSKQDLSGFLGIKEKHIPKFIAEVAKQ